MYCETKKNNVPPKVEPYKLFKFQKLPYFSYLIVITKHLRKKKNFQILEHYFFSFSGFYISKQKKNGSINKYRTNIKKERNGEIFKYYRRTSQKVKAS